MRAGTLFGFLSVVGMLGQGCSAPDPGIGDPTAGHRGTTSSSSGSGTSNGGGPEGTSSGGSSGGSSGVSGGGSGSGSSSSGSGSGSGGNASSSGAVDDAGSGSGSGGLEGGGGAGAFGAACTQNTDCMSNDCQLFQGKGGNYCTQPCQTDADCPNPPNLGCNMMGQCKVP